MRCRSLAVLLLLTLMSGTAAESAWAQGEIRIGVETVLASHGPEYSDPRLSGLIEELKSLFRYSSYRLLGREELRLRDQETGRVSLPGQRVLQVTRKGVTEQRVELELVILKKKKIFETVVQLLNNGSIIVGGPKYQDGSLLFNVSTAF